MRHIVAKLNGNFYRNGPIFAGCDKIAKRYFTVLDQSEYEFEPQGFTSIWLLSESHFSIHTFPEKGYAMVDIFHCGNSDLPFILEDLAKQLKSTIVSKELIKR